MKTITFASVKGGVGKSTSAILTAWLFSHIGRTLLIDIGPESSSTLHLMEKDPECCTVRQLLKGEKDITDCTFQVGKNLFFVPSEIELAIIEQEIAGRTNKEFILFEALDSIKEDFDYCIIDTPGYAGFIANSAAITSDWIIIPSQMERWASRSIKTTIESFKDIRRSERFTGKHFEFKILPTFFNDKQVVNQTYLEKVRQAYGNMVSKTVVHRTTDISRAFSQTQVFPSHTSRAVKEYTDFISELE